MRSIPPNQHLGVYMVDGGPFRRLYCLLIVLLLLGCSSARHGQILSLLKEYQENNVLIGNLSDTYFEFVNFADGSNPRLARTPLGGRRLIGMPNAPSQKTADGKTATCDHKQCTIFDPESKSTKSLFNSDDVVTPLYWSPDGRLLLFVRDVKRLRLPLRCGWDDEHDVVVYDPSSCKEEIVTTVCGGYPYRQFGWFVGETS